MGTKTSGHIFHWRFVKDVVKRELSSPWKRRGSGQQGRRKYPRKGYTRCRGGSSGCGPHNTPPGQKNKAKQQELGFISVCLFLKSLIRSFGFVVPQGADSTPTFHPVSYSRWSRSHTPPSRYRVPSPLHTHISVNTTFFFHV